MSECKCKELSGFVKELIKLLLAAQTSEQIDQLAGHHHDHYTITANQDNDFHELIGKLEELRDGN